jgi:hypothetical protein
MNEALITVSIQPKSSKEIIQVSKVNKVPKRGFDL